MHKTQNPTKKMKKTHRIILEVDIDIITLQVFVIKKKKKLLYKFYISFIIMPCPWISHSM